MSEAEINEKLVEEIRKEHCKTCLFLRRFDKGGMEYLEDRCAGNLELCRERIRRDIRRTLSAVCDNKLDEVLGVVGRQEIDWLTMDRQIPLHIKGCKIGDILIALRQEEAGEIPK